MADYNILVSNSYTFPDDGIFFFDGEPYTEVPQETTIWDILVMCGVYPSKGQAKKNWRGPAHIPGGFTDWKGVGKLRHRITIFNATKPYHDSVLDVVGASK